MEELAKRVAKVSSGSQDNYRANLFVIFAHVGDGFRALSAGIHGNPPSHFNALSIPATMTVIQRWYVLLVG
jgi:hypothetical protein